MKYPQFLEKQEAAPVKDVRARRRRKSEGRLVLQLEGHLGHPLDLPKKAWPKAIERLMKFNETDWREVRQLGDKATALQFK